MLLNKSRAIDFMRRHGVDAIIATTPANVTYFADYFCWTDSLFKEYMMSPGAPSQLTMNCAILPAEGAPALVIGPTYVMSASESWVQDFRLYGEFGLDTSLPGKPSNDLERRLLALLREAPRCADAVEGVVAVLRDRGLEDARLGIDLESAPAATQEAFRKALPRASIKNCSNLIRLIRMVKSPEELRRLTRAAEISEKAAFEAFELARPGVSALELTRSYRASTASMGADFDHFALGPRGLSIFTDIDYHFAPNDVMFADFGCIYEHYFSDGATTLAIGGLPAGVPEKFEAVRRCLDAGIALLRPGVKGSEIQAAMNGALRESGITTAFPHGHGVGIEIRDYPILVPDNHLRIKDDCVDVASDLPMEEGMVNNLEGCVFMPLVGSVTLEETYLVTAEGHRQLIPQPRRSPFVVAS